VIPQSGKSTQPVSVLQLGSSNIITGNTAKNQLNQLMANSLLSTGLVTTCRQETSSQSRPRTPTPLLCTSIAQPSEATLSLVAIAVAPLQLNRTTGASQRHGNWATKLVPPQLQLALQRSSLCSPSSEHDKIQMARR